MLCYGMALSRAVRYPFAATREGVVGLLASTLEAIARHSGVHVALNSMRALPAAERRFALSALTSLLKRRGRGSDRVALVALHQHVGRFDVPVRSELAAALANASSGAAVAVGEVATARRVQRLQGA